MVRDDQLEVQALLREHGIDRLGERAAVVVRGDHHAQRGCAAHSATFRRKEKRLCPK